MSKVYALFFLLSFLLFAFSIFVLTFGSQTRIPFMNEEYIFSERSICWTLSLLGLVFALLYLYFQNILYSERWSWMHFICFVFLAINILSYSFIQRYGIVIEQQGDDSLFVLQRVARVEDMLMGSMWILLFMQIVFPLNLLLGLFRRKRVSRD